MGKAEGSLKIASSGPKSYSGAVLYFSDDFPYASAWSQPDQPEFHHVLSRPPWKLLTLMSAAVKGGDSAARPGGHGVPGVRRPVPRLLRKSAREEALTLHQHGEVPRQKHLAQVSDLGPAVCTCYTSVLRFLQYKE